MFLRQTKRSNVLFRNQPKLVLPVVRKQNKGTFTRKQAYYSVLLFRKYISNIIISVHMYLKAIKKIETVQHFLVGGICKT